MLDVYVLSTNEELLDFLKREFRKNKSSELFKQGMGLLRDLRSENGKDAPSHNEFDYIFVTEPRGNVVSEMLAEKTQKIDEFLKRNQSSQN